MVGTSLFLALMVPSRSSQLCLPRLILIASHRASFCWNSHCSCFLWRVFLVRYMSIWVVFLFTWFRPSTVDLNRGSTSFWQSVGIHLYRLRIASHAPNVSALFMRSITVDMVLISTLWYVGRTMWFSLFD